MKKILFVITAVLLLGILLASVPARADDYTVYLPLVSVPREAIIDCMDGNGNFIPCP